MSLAQDITRQYGPAYLPALKGLAIVGSLWNAGSMTTAYRLLPSIYPAVQKSRRDAAKQWEFYYWALSATVPLCDLATIIICGSLAYVEHKGNKAGLPWKLWATATGIMPFGWVWVWTLMLAPSNKLLAVANPGILEVGQKDSTTDQQNTIDLLKEFNSLMGVRMMFPWVVGGLAIWASLSK